MIIAAWLLGATLGATAAPAQHDHAGDNTRRPVTLDAGLTGVHHAIQTKSAEAQKFFDQGLTLIYAFNHEEAVRSFERATELDPESPMPYWGIALALGPNINQDVDLDREKAAYEAVQRAVKLADRAPANERAYVAALVTRYSNDPKADLKALAVQYKDAMKALTQRYPDDLDAATLYAESLMDLRPWQLWSSTGAPEEGTLEIVAVLESVLARDAQHVGANHYYIHATEASLTPDRALESAKRLETLVPSAGHLVHMPAHTYMRTGDYAGAVKANAAAVDIDRKYIADAGANGAYPTMYYNHNLDFLASAAMMTGQFARASQAADELVRNVTPIIADMPMVEPFAAKKLYVLVRFAKWQDALNLPMPDSQATIATTLFHFGRAVAHAALGNVADAGRERDAYQAAKQRVPAGAMIGYNRAAAIFLVCDAVLDARIAAAGNNLDSAIQAWQKAVAAEDALSYDEPSDWFYPTRESLGAAYFRAKRYEEADRTFREDLERNPDNPRSLFALWQMVGVVGEPDDPVTMLLRRHFREAWTEADVELKFSEF